MKNIYIDRYILIVAGSMNFDFLITSNILSSARRYEDIRHKNRKPEKNWEGSVSG